MDLLSVAQIEAVAASHRQLSELLQTILSIFGEQITFLRLPAGGDRSSAKIIADFETLSFQRAEVGIQIDSPTVQAGLCNALLKLDLAASGKPIVRTLTGLSGSEKSNRKYLEPLVQQISNVIDHALIRATHLKMGFAADTLLEPFSSPDYRKEAAGFAALPAVAVRALAKPWWTTEYLTSWSGTIYRTSKTNLDALVQAAAQNVADFQFVASEIRLWFYHGDFRSPFTYPQAFNDLLAIAQLPRIHQMCQLVPCPSSPPILEPLPIQGLGTCRVAQRFLIRDSQEEAARIAPLLPKSEQPRQENQQEFKRRDKAISDFCHQMDELKDALERYSTRPSTVYRRAAVALQVLLFDGKPPLCLRVLRKLELQPLIGQKTKSELAAEGKKPASGMKLVMRLPAIINNQTFQEFPIEQMFDPSPDRKPLELGEWLDQALFNEKVSIRGLITAVRNREGAHADQEFHDILEIARSGVLGDEYMHAPVLMAIARYIFGVFEASALEWQDYAHDLLKPMRR
jgi:hypothetical protein